jgi:putative salt-induced outer membrane protein YdiY
VNRTNSILFALLISWPLSAAAEAVDEITLKDGSVLRGEITRVEDDELVLDTDYADDVFIEVEHIDRIESDRQYTVRLLDGEKISGYLTVSDGKISVRESPPATGDREAAAEPKEVEPADTEPTASSIPDTPAEQQAFSFDDIDWIDEKQTYFRYEAEVNLGAQAARGNTDTTDLHFDALFKPTFGWNTIRLLGEFDKKEADGDTTTDRWRGSLEYERDLGRRWFIGASNSYEADAQRDLDLRIIAAAGAGYRFFDKDPTLWSVMLGVAYVHETFENSDDDADFAALRWKLDFSRDLYKDDITFYHNHVYINSLQNFSNIEIETKTGIEFDLAWDFTLTAEFQSNWDNEPAIGNKEWDTRYILKIGFEFEGDQKDWFH